MEEQQEKFEGYAIVEIMGHQKVAGFVTTVAFGSTVMFKVVQDECPAEERILNKDEWLGGRYIYQGSKVRASRKRAETYVGASSVYRMTPCSQVDAFRLQPVDFEVLEMAERKELPEPTGNMFSFEEDEDQNDD